MASNDRNTPMPPSGPIGQIGNYDVIKKLAVGGMGEVFLARQRGPNALARQVVLKRLHPQFSNDPQFVSMFLNEAQIAANIAHPNIAHIYELFEDPEHGFIIAMEYIRGGTVLTLMREARRAHGGGLPFGAAARITIAVCEALHHAYFEADDEGYARRIIHRDVTPSNVMCSYDGQVKLLDFGIAKVTQSDATKATALKGKFGYMSPEQVRSQSLDHRTDIFSLGTMMWEMFVGKRLFKREGDMQMLYAIIEEPIPSPAEHLPLIPPRLDTMIMRALARDREARYQDASDLAQDLRAIAKDNDWDVEPSTFGRLVKTHIPEGLSASGAGSGSGKRGSDSGRSPSSGPKVRPSGSLSVQPSVRPSQIGLTPVGMPSMVSREFDDPHVAIEHEPLPTIVPTNEPAPPPPAPAPPVVAASSGNAFVIAVLVLVLLSSVAFWIGIAPNL